MERSSSSYTSETRSRMLCLYNVEAPLVTSWTEDNPGRRFYGCGLYKVTGRKGCNYFEWHDPVANIRQKKIMVTLMKKVDELESREKDLQSRIRDTKRKEIFLGILLVVCWEESDVAELMGFDLSLDQCFVSLLQHGWDMVIVSSSSVKMYNQNHKNGECN
ncbi:hypothetical protein HKD37_13G035342 [Glycine soja]